MTRTSSAKEVVAALVIRDGLHLVCRRPQRKRHGGLWEFAGGKVVRGETREKAAKRELKEELGLDVIAVGDCLYEVDDPGSTFRLVFVPVTVEGTPRSIEHSEIRWVTMQELTELPFAPGDERFISEYLLKESEHV